MSIEHIYIVLGICAIVFLTGLVILRVQYIDNVENGLEMMDNLIMNKDCSHTETVYGHWEYSNDEDLSDTWIGEYEKPTVVDVNTRSYKCTQCGKILSY